MSIILPGAFSNDFMMLSPEVLTALQDLARESGQVFLLQDGRGRTSAVAPVGSDGALIAVPDFVVWDRAVPVRLPGGESGLLNLQAESSAWDSAHDAWLRAGACMLSSALRMDATANQMAGEIARTFEELFLLYFSSAALCVADSTWSVCEVAVSLAAKHIRHCPAAIYLHRPAEDSFVLAAWHGPASLWAPEVAPNRAIQNRHLFSDSSLITDRMSPSELEALGVLSSVSGHLLCAPLRRTPGEEAILGWLVLYDRGHEGPFHWSDGQMASTLAAQAALYADKAGENEQHRQELLMGTIRSLASAVDAKDSYTHGHSLRVTSYALSVAREMERAPEEMQALELAGLLHDVGKIGVPDHVLSKPGMLDEQEWAQMRRHTLIGASIVAEVPGLHPIVREGIRSHHEWWDGGGYPDCLRGESISLAGRILSVADCFDAMTSNRPYRRALDVDTAIENMIAVSGRQLDPDILGAFLDAYTSGRLEVPGGDRVTG